MAGPADLIPARLQAHRLPCRCPPQARSPSRSPTSPIAAVVSACRPLAVGSLYLLSGIVVAETLKGAPKVGLLQGIEPALSGVANPTVSPRAAEVKFISHHALPLIAGSVVAGIAVGGAHAGPAAARQRDPLSPSRELVDDPSVGSLRRRGGRGGQHRPSGAQRDPHAPFQRWPRLLRSCGRIRPHEGHGEHDQQLPRPGWRGSRSRRG